LRRSETSPKVDRTSLPSRLSPKCRSPHLIAGHQLEEPSLISRRVRQQVLRNSSPGVVMCGPFQRLGPNAGGGAERGSGRCLSCEVVVVRRVAGTAAGIAGSWFGVSSSCSRMRHQRAAAGWSSGRGPPVAADRTSRVASKPARVRLFNLSTSSGIKWSAVALGTSGARSCRHCRAGLTPVGGFRARPHSSKRSSGRNAQLNT
jgi:hypothetical protein